MLGKGEHGVSCLIGLCNVLITSLSLLFARFDPYQVFEVSVCNKMAGLIQSSLIWFTCTTHCLTYVTTHVCIFFVQNLSTRQQLLVQTTCLLFISSFFIISTIDKSLTEWFTLWIQVDGDPGSLHINRLLTQILLLLFLMILLGVCFDIE